MTIYKDAPIELVITTSHRVYDTLGGVEKFVESFSSWCGTHDIKVTVLSRSLSINPVKITYGQALIHRNEKIHFVKKVQLPFQLYYLGLSFFSLSAFIALLRLVKKSRLHGRKNLVFHSQDINFAALATVSVGKLMKIPTIIHQHGPYEKLLPSKNMRILEQSINKVTCCLCDFIIATDKYTKEYLTKIKINDKKIFVIPAAVENRFFEEIDCKACIDPLSIFKIGYIGRLSAEKNLEVLLFAFKEFRSTHSSECKLMIVGDGDLKSVLEKLTIHIGINESVEFTGFRTDIRPFLSTFDIFVLPSKIEGTPISLIEAMAAGKAIIASNIPAIREIIDDGKDALLFELNSYTQLKDKMSLLFSHPELRVKLGKNAKNKSQQYAADIVFSNFLELYKNIYANKLVISE
jgi:glycosyltransferase involved in cell wall biosynthesis